MVLNACPRLASWVLTRGTAPVTSTVTVPPATCIGRLSVAGVLTRSVTSVRFSLANPGASTVTEYVAGGTSRN